MRKLCQSNLGIADVGYHAVGVAAKTVMPAVAAESLRGGEATRCAVIAHPLRHGEWRFKVLDCGNRTLDRLLLLNWHCIQSQRFRQAIDLDKFGTLLVHVSHRG